MLLNRLFSKLFGQPMYKMIKVGDVIRNDDNSEILILAMSDNKKRVRFAYITLNGKPAEHVRFNPPIVWEYDSEYTIGGIFNLVVCHIDDINGYFDERNWKRPPFEEVHKPFRR